MSMTFNVECYSDPLGTDGRLLRTYRRITWLTPDKLSHRKLTHIVSPRRFRSCGPLPV